MNTPPPEEDTFKPDPFPSVSTPATFRHQHEDEASFDRISDILSNLIKEANEAVQGIERERGRLGCHRQDNRSNVNAIRTTSKLPRPKRLSLPPPPPSPRTPMEPLVESFKRLDSSMAIVDSLSRDLASSAPRENNNSLTENQFNIILVVPLLHIPHAFITTLFHAATPNLTGMLAWACLFALGSLIIPPTEQDTLHPPHRYCQTLPGSYIEQQQQQQPLPTAGREEDKEDPRLSTPPPPLPPSSSSSSALMLVRPMIRKRRPLRRSIYRKRASALVVATPQPSSPATAAARQTRQSLFINLEPKEQSKRGRRHSM